MSIILILSTFICTLFTLKLEAIEMIVNDKDNLNIENEESIVNYIEDKSIALTNDELSDYLPENNKERSLERSTPVLNFRYISSYTNQNVTVIVYATSNSGVNRITLPDGNTVYDDNLKYTITSNGSYTFTARNGNGVTSSKTLNINIIDKQAPTLNTTVNVATNRQSATINLNAIDNGVSGIKEIILYNGNVVKSSSTTVTVRNNGQYLFCVRDKAGNISVKQATVSDIDYKYISGINRIEYRLEGSTTKGWTVYNGPFTMVDEGIVNVVARAIDNAGNVSDDAQLEVKIDKTKPGYNTIVIKPAHNKN